MELYSAWGRTAFLTLGILVAPLAKVYGYDDPAHYYTTAAAIAHLEPSILTDEEKRVLSFCAWMPDETHELNAVGVAADVFGSRTMESYFSSSYFSMMGWALWESPTAIWELNKFGRYDEQTGPAINSDQEKAMVAVQQLLHGLTGSPNAGSVTTLARQLIKIFTAKVVADKTGHAAPESPSYGPAMSPTASQYDAALSQHGVTDYTNLCALGFALHLYGDSFAHRMLTQDREGSTLQMYATGLGHVKVGNVPDHPLCNAAREKEWQKNYATGATFGLGTPNPGAMNQALFDCAAQKAAYHQDSSRYRVSEDPRPNCIADQGSDTDSEDWLKQQMIKVAQCGGWSANYSTLNCPPNPAVASTTYFQTPNDNLGDPCREYLKRNLDCAPNQTSACVLPNNLHLTCDNVWDRYAQEASKAFIAWSDRNADASHWVTRSYWTKYYGAKPLWK